MKALSLPHFARTDCDCNCGYVFDEKEQCIATIHYKHDDSTEESDYPPLEDAIENAKIICDAPVVLAGLTAMRGSYQAKIDWLKKEVVVLDTAKERVYATTVRLACEEFITEIDKILLR